ncbi:MAG: SMP-30/gluconolactonase/LRE family protein, partial [Spongiibacteraceae bacterium]|nr:SMP-30/gluconolactonase/LRE family protein [Spongiibacteraceae bacterium]
KRSDHAGHCEKVVDAPGGPNGLALAPDGRVFIASQGHGVMVYDPEQNTLRVVAGDYQGEPIKGANDLAFDAEGGLYVTVPQGDLFNPRGRVFYLPPGGGEPVQVASGLSYPNGIAVSADGQRILVAEMMMKRILAVPAVGKESPFNVTYVWARTAGGVGPDGIHLGADGRLYVANLERGELLVYSSDAMLEQTIPLPEQAGPVTTNVTSDGQHLFITESGKGEVWQLPLPAHSQ